MNINPKHFQKDLMSWYNNHARDLPWRRSNNPYYIWLSEVMLQQTQVKTVIPYYEKFIHTFPNIEDLAQASEDTLMQYWQGLGYYRRAKYLHLAAKRIVSDFDGKLPKTAQELIDLKGFGEYTSASVASIAFGQAIACVDGNVKRVMARLFADDSEPKEKSQSLLDEKNPGDYNQAIMELGATICTPKNPQCLLCPVQKHCTALKQGQVDQFPIKAKKIKQKNIYAAIVLVEHDGHFLMQKRTQPGRWENLWQNPTLESDTNISQNNVTEWLKQLLGQTITQINSLNSFNHKLTHQNINATVFHTHLTKQLKPTEQHQNQQWVEQSKIKTFGISQFQKKAFRKFFNTV